MEKHAHIVSFEEFNKVRDQVGTDRVHLRWLRPASSRSCILHYRVQAIWRYPRGRGQRGQLPPTEERQGLHGPENPLLHCFLPAGSRLRHSLRDRRRPDRYRGAASRSPACFHQGRRPGRFSQHPGMAGLPGIGDRTGLAGGGTKTLEQFGFSQGMGRVLR